MIIVLLSWLLLKHVFCSSSTEDDEPDDLEEASDSVASRNNDHNPECSDDKGTICQH